MLKAIIFDFDGVIINEYDKHLGLAKRVFTDLSEEEFRALFNGNIHVEKEKLKSRDTGFDLTTAFNEHKSTVQVAPQVRECLEQLSQRYMLGIITSAREWGTKTCLANSGCETLFSFLYGYETHKLKTEKFRMAFENFRMTKEECVYVTDTLGDILEANAMGVRTIALDFGYHDRTTLQQGNPTTIVSSWKELVDAVKEL